MTFSIIAIPYSCVVARITRSGNLIWATKLDAADYMIPQSIKATSDGGVILVMKFDTIGSNKAGVVTKLNSAGNVVWSRHVVAFSDTYLSGV